MGDGVYELFVREHLACLANRPAGELNSRKVQLVKASAQAEAFRKISNLLSEKELAIFKRGENAHPPHSAKNASSADYHAATGLEALFGWLYLSEQQRGQRNFLK